MWSLCAWTFVCTKTIVWSWKVLQIRAAKIASRSFSLSFRILKHWIKGNWIKVDKNWVFLHYQRKLSTHLFVEIIIKNWRKNVNFIRYCKNTSNADAFETLKEPCKYFSFFKQTWYKKVAKLQTFFENHYYLLCFNKFLWYFKKIHHFKVC